MSVGLRNNLGLYLPSSGVHYSEPMAKVRALHGQLAFSVDWQIFFRVTSTLIEATLVLSSTPWVVLAYVTNTQY